VRPIRGALALVASLPLCALPALAGADAEPIAASGGPPGVEAVALEDAPDPLFDSYGELDDPYEDQPEVYDPFEPANRMILSFNMGVDQVLWSPLTVGYRFVVPEPGRRAMRRAFANLNTPVFVVNHLLQLHPLEAAETLGAFVMNTTFGMGGLFDAGESVGLSRSEADFGQTLARAGVGTGPYIVVPLFGPTTARDGFGWVVDRAFHPATYFIGVPIQLIWRGGAGVAQREAVSDAMEALEESSLDFYAVLRSAYSQARQREVDREASATDKTVASSL